MTAFTDRVAEQCFHEFKRFRNGTGHETKDPFAGFVGEYWKVGLKINNIDGRTTFQDANGKPFRPAWSAAFVSFIMRTCGAGTQFHYNQAHIHYVVQALRDTKAGSTTAKFLGRDPRSYAPKVGDIVNAGRGASAGVTF